MTFIPDTVASLITDNQEFSRTVTQDTVSSLVTSRTLSFDTSAYSNPDEFSANMVALHERVFTSGVPNYRGLRIPLVSELNIPRWRSFLSAYHDNNIVDYLEFGWPVGYDYEQFGFPVSQLRNHSGATNYPRDLNLYIDTEIARHSVAGPFSSLPFSGRLAVSPLNSVPKKDSVERRIILDLSWPLNTSVNVGVDNSLHEGVEFSLTYPTVDHIASLIARKGPGCLIYKCDLRKAYRQFYVDPYDFPLLGFHWNDCYYFDVVLPMGLRSAAMACQRITSDISYICSQQGFDVLNYLGTNRKVLSFIIKCPSGGCQWTGELRSKDVRYSIFRNNFCELK